MDIKDSVDKFNLKISKLSSEIVEEYYSLIKKFTNKNDKVSSITLMNLNIPDEWDDSEPYMSIKMGGDVYQIPLDDFSGTLKDENIMSDSQIQELNDIFDFVMNFRFIIGKSRL